MSIAGLSILSWECRDACQGEVDFEQRVRKAMAVVAKTHYMYAGNHYADLRFKGALGGVLLAPETTDEEKARIMSTLEQLRNLSALMNGVPVDAEAMLADQEKNPSLPLMKWWNEARDA